MQKTESSIYRETVYVERLPLTRFQTLLGLAFPLQSSYAIIYDIYLFGS